MNTPNRLPLLLILFVATFLFVACSSGNITVSNPFNSGAPSDDDVQRILVNELRMSNVVIRDKQPCELTANIRAMGISERWIIAYDAVNSSQRQITNDRVTIQKRDNEWQWFNAMAYCG